MLAICRTDLALSTGALRWSWKEKKNHPCEIKFSVDLSGLRSGSRYQSCHPCHPRMTPSPVRGADLGTSLGIHFFHSFVIANRGQLVFLLESALLTLSALPCYVTPDALCSADQRCPRCRSPGARLECLAKMTEMGGSPGSWNCLNGIRSKVSGLSVELGLSIHHPLGVARPSYCADRPRTVSKWLFICKSHVSHLLKSALHRLASA